LSAVEFQTHYCSANLVIFSRPY